MGRRASTNKINMVQISISLPQALVDAIDEMARRDNRNRSNFIAHTLQVLADKAGVMPKKKVPKIDSK